MMMFGSCATFETPISRSLTTPGSSGASENSDYQSAEVGVPQYGSKKIDLIESTSFENAAQFDWPVDEARMTRGYLPKKRRPHLGIDLAAPRGTPILAAQSGTVIYAGREFSGYGNMVLIESGRGWATLYAHMDKIVISEGQKVTQGQILGAMGRTGRATGVHLHFEIRKDRGPIDPLPLLQKGQGIARARVPGPVYGPGAHLSEVALNER